MYSNKSLTEKELLMDLLTSEKHLTTAYNNAIIQSQCPQLRQIYSECLSSAQEIQFSLYDATERRGWNKINLASSREIESMVKKYSELI